jgi:hypothetical protein
MLQNRLNVRIFGYCEEVITYQQSKRNDLGNRRGIGKMSINFKQEELIDELVNTLIKKFPEVEFINISESPEDSESLWIVVYI